MNFAGLQRRKSLKVKKIVESSLLGLKTKNEEPYTVPLLGPLSTERLYLRLWSIQRYVSDLIRGDSVRKMLEQVFVEVQVVTFRTNHTENRNSLSKLKVEVGCKAVLAAPITNKRVGHDRSLIKTNFRHKSNMPISHHEIQRHLGIFKSYHDQ